MAATTVPFAQPMTARAAAKVRSVADLFHFERERRERGCSRIAGVDEAGRGPLAGPVVAAAVVLPHAWLQSGLPAGLEGLNDSKQLTEAQRERFFEQLIAESRISCGIASADSRAIDRWNILQATHQSMNAALAKLDPAPTHVLVDGRPVNSLTFPQTALVKGDSRSYSIAAASILAKVTRDRLMREYHEQWPHYGFADHKGYGTPQHLAAITEHGPCPIHRMTFAPLKPREPHLL
jgi:ribonuclease HII